MSVLATALLLALSRAEIVARFKAPVLSQAEGNVKVYASCAEDVRREYQGPVARFAGETFAALARAARRPLPRAASPALVLHLGDVRTNRADVVVRVSTNGTKVATRIYLPNPATADLETLRAEVARAYVRFAEGREASPAEALEAWRMTDRDYRVARDLRRLEAWLDRGEGDDAEGFSMLWRVFRPGTLSEVEARVFASRLRLYPATFDRPFLGRFASLSFREAVACAADPAVRLAARRKADEMPVFGGGRGEALRGAAAAYRVFLLALAKGGFSEGELRDLLEAADVALNVAFASRG